MKKKYFSSVSEPSLSNKIDRAKFLIERVANHARLLCRIHYSNRELISDASNLQVSPSYALHTLNLLKTTQYRYEVLRLSAIWDKPSKNRESIPSILNLIQDNNVRDELEQIHISEMESNNVFLDYDENDEAESGDQPVVSSSEIRELQKLANSSFAINDAAYARQKLDTAIVDADKFMKSTHYKSWGWPR